jgi:RarD protein
VALGAWLAGERFSAHDLGAMAVILAGVVAITLGRARAPRPTAVEHAGPAGAAGRTAGDRRYGQGGAGRNDRGRPDRRGLWVAAGSFVVWGLMPLYWHLLKAVPSLQIVMHRIVWSALLVVGWLCWKQGGRWLRLALAKPRVAWMLASSGLLIAFNWGLYIWAVNAGHVVETSLGYFINPLLNVLLGVLLLRERLSAAQWVSVAVAAMGVLWLTFNYGGFPWIALSLAASFAFYGFIRKLAEVDSIPGLAIESLYLFVPAVAAAAVGRNPRRRRVFRRHLGCASTRCWCSAAR